MDFVQAKKLILYLWLLLIAFNSYSQESVIKGKVIDLNSRVPLQYVNISLLRGNYHTNTDAKGFFSIQADTSMLSDTVYFSSVGYASRLIPIRGLHNMIVGLTPISVPLQDIKVTGKKIKKKTFTIDPLSEVETSQGPSHDLFIMLNDTGCCSEYLILTKYFRVGKNLGKYKYLKSIGITENFVLKSLAKSTPIYATHYCDNWKLLLRVFEEDSLKHRPGKDLLNENLTISKGDVKYFQTLFPGFSNIKNYDSVLSDYKRRPKYYGFIYVNLEKYKIPIPKRGLYAGVEILPESGACGFSIASEPSRDTLIWAARKYKGKLGSEKRTGRLRISLEVTE